jgi:hypothetical protein
MCHAGQGCLPVILRDGIAKHSLVCLGRVLFTVPLWHSGKFEIWVAQRKRRTVPAGLNPTVVEASCIPCRADLQNGRRGGRWRRRIFDGTRPRSCALFICGVSSCHDVRKSPARRTLLSPSCNFFISTQMNTPCHIMPHGQESFSIAASEGKGCCLKRLLHQVPHLKNLHAKYIGSRCFAPSLGAVEDSHLHHLQPLRRDSAQRRRVLLGPSCACATRS